MIKRLVYVVSLVLSATVMASIDGHTIDNGRVDILMGVNNVEDLVAIPHSPWIIGSGVGSWRFHGGALHLINEDQFTVSTVDLNDFNGEDAQAPYDQCDSAPDPSAFSAHGLSLVPHGENTYKLYVVNHGGREAIEVFHISLATAEPTFSWVGCVYSPSMTFPNAVAGRSDGSIVLSVTMDLNGYVQRVFDGECCDKTGAVFSWNKQSGWEYLEGSAFAQNNGIELSQDEQWAFVASLPDASVTRIPLDPSLGEATRIPLAFYPDNIRRSPDGKLLVAGVENTGLLKVNWCVGINYPHCAIDYRADKIDPETLQVTPVYSGQGSYDFGLATSALETATGLWFGSVRTKTVVRVRYD